ncbi:succinylglutamate-semialdehyde dehydrogenase [Vibrio sp. UCD-FRSSP16_10]|uniref:succinylglutamate-semialdehyde dehydrogenase n=1 Tax=unclassified Vibrio TaxID=2614977 RepID=UPI0008000E2D|nr:MULTISPECIES: succinylglutamate-semialdehyde dehydrogenase [unclassified Vibrio]OBT10060.1 succinylglutamate-semialdehyde dehydrogenase [Vibrio sp. UCD-FRSSP16_30]OBT18850.1 succinylglutamate-semialdehyde dehydrogenase [Vibrio sp. UCD-FRSSP16_10]
MQTHFIAGEWISGQGHEIQSLSPYNSDVIWQGHSASTGQVDLAVSSARHAFLSWKKYSFAQREKIVLGYAQLLKDNAELIAETVAKETGKPLWETRTEAAAMAGKIALSIQSYHERTGTKHKQVAGNDVTLQHRPLGVLAVFGPYNFPMHLPNGHIVPALLAGNTVVFKPSDLTPLCGELAVKLWHEAGLPNGVINLVQGAKDTGVALAQSSQIDGLLFTGSANTGHILHRQFAGQPEKMLALEMGGNNPLIVSKQYGEIDAAVHTIVQSAFISAGQRCTCARRLYIPQGEAGDTLLQRLVDVTAKLNMDQPFAKSQPFMGSLISQTAAEQIISAKQSLIALGAKVLLNGELLNDAFVAPIILDVTDITQLPDEEYFGPLLQVVRFSEFSDAVALANNTKYGLSAGLISTNDDEWALFCDEIRAGIVNRNRPITGASGDAPFGGPGASGNLRPSAFYAADYCAYPMASIQGEAPILPDTLSPGMVFD